MNIRSTNARRLKNFYLHEDQKPFIVQHEAETDIRNLLSCTDHMTRRSQQRQTA